MTRTYAILDVSDSTYQEVYQKLSEAQYFHVFHDTVIDMHGIALRSGSMSEDIERTGIPADVDRMLKWFDYDHLPPHLKEMSVKFHSLATTLTIFILPGPERTVTLRKLLEAKDAAVRAMVHPGG